MTGRSIGILGTGSYLPQRLVTNDEIAELVPTSTAEWIERRTLIGGRYWAAENEATSDLAAHAAREALRHAGRGPEDVDHILVSTSTGDSPQPPTACLVQHAIGTVNAACVDINAVCAGFVAGLDLARALVGMRPDTLVLVIGADLYSRSLDLDDRSTAVLLGDGAGAVLVGAVPQPYGLLSTRVASHGVDHELIRVAAGGSRLPASHATVDAGDHFFCLNGRGVRDFVVEHVPVAVAAFLAAAGYETRDVDHFVPHQANGMLLWELTSLCGLDAAHTHAPVERIGNTGSASIPVALDEAHRAGALADGDLVLLAGFGGGLSLGTALVRWLTPREGRA